MRIISLYLFILGANSAFADFKKELYFAQIQANCDAEDYILLNSQQPQSSLGLYVFRANQLKSIAASNCKIVTKMQLEGELRDFLLKDNLAQLTFLSNWREATKKSKRLFAENLFAIKTKVTKQQAQYVNILLLGVLYESYELSKAIKLADHISETSQTPYFLAAAVLVKSEALLRSDEPTKAKEILHNKRNLFNTIRYYYAASFRLRSLYLMAEIELNLGETESAGALLEAANDFISTDHQFNSNDLITLKDNFGYYYVRKAFVESHLSEMYLQQAIDAEYEALTIAHQYKNHRKLIIIHNNTAFMYMYANRLDDAIRHFLIALNWLQTYSDKEREILIFRNIAGIYKRLGVLDRARDYYIQAIVEFGDNTSKEKLRTDCELGKIYSQLGHEKRARNHLGSCNVLLNEPQTTADDRLSMLLGIQNIWLHTDEKKIRLVEINTLLDLATIPDNIAYAYLLLAENALSENNIDSASNMLNIVVNTLKNSTRSVTQFDIYERAYELSRVRPRFKHFTSFFGDNARAILNDVLNSLEPTEIGAAWIHKGQKLLSMSIEGSLQNNTEKALNFALFMREQNFNNIRRTAGKINYETDNFKVSTLATITLKNMLKDLPSNSAKLHHTIIKDLFWLRLITNEKDLSKEAIVQHQLAKSVGLTTKTDTSFGDAIGKLKDLIASENQMVLVYIINDYFSGFFSYKPKETKFYRLPKASILNAKINEMHDLLSRRHPRAYSKIKEVRELILPKNFRELSAANLVIFADGPAHKIPFDLIFSQGKNIQIKQSLDNEIKSIEQLKSLAVFSISEKFSGLANVDNPILNMLPSLKMAALESKALIDKFEGHSKLYNNRFATKNSFLSEEVRSANILHLSLHHLFNPKRPMDIGLLLASDGESDDNDFFISSAEINYSTFASELVFLNGCGTYNGKIYQGEGIAGLARSFLNAGANNVISTMWPVSDRASAEFTRLFYPFYFESKDAVASLAKAKIELSKNPRFRHPFYWAGYTISSQ